MLRMHDSIKLGSGSDAESSRIVTRCSSLEALLASGTHRDCILPESLDVLGQPEAMLDPLSHMRALQAAAAHLSQIGCIVCMCGGQDLSQRWRPASWNVCTYVGHEGIRELRQAWHAAPCDGEGSAPGMQHLGFRVQHAS